MNSNDEFVQNFDLKTNEHKPKKRKKTSFIIAGILTICIIATVSILLYLKAMISPSERLIEGYTKLFNVSENYIADELDIEKISKSKESTTRLDLTADSFPCKPQLEGLGINSIVTKNKQKKKLESITGVTYCGTAVMSSDIYIENNTLYIAVPSLFDKVLTIDLSKIEDLKDSSYILQQIPKDFYQRFDMSIFQDIWNIGKYKNDPITIADYIKETSPKEWKKICEGIEISEIKDSDDIKLSISGSSIKLFLERSVDVIVENKRFNMYLERIKNNFNVDYSLEEVHLSMKSMVSVLSLLLSDGVDIYTTLNSDNQITAIKCENKFGFMGIKLNALMKVDFKGTDNPKDEYTGLVNLCYNKQEINFSFSKKQNLKDNSMKVSSENIYNICYNDLSIISIKTSSEYTKTADKHNAFSDFLGCSKPLKDINNVLTKYNTSASITCDLFSPFTLDIQLSGDISDVSRGRSYTVNLETFKAAVNSSEIISLSGSYSFSNKAASIQKPDGDTSDLLKMEEKDFRIIYSQINGNLQRLIKSYWELKE